ncbi:MAG: putative porin [Bacteroidales bacterium]|nr:putative porin [Bacteroidales bacterium]
MKLYTIFLFVLAALIFWEGTATAQTYDSTFYPRDSSAVLYFRNKLDTYSPVKLTPIDTTLTDFEAYNPLDTMYFFYASLGNVGLAYKNLDFTLQNKVGFDYGINTFKAYFLDQQDIKYYLNPRAYTEIGYVTGADKEQLFNASHHQRVFKRLALGVDFNLINSLGTYQRQKSDDVKVAVSGQFFTKDLRYGAIANYTNARVRVRENGGIIYDSIYEQDIETNRSIIDIHLTEAENKLRKSGLYLQQYFQLSRKIKKPKNDSVPAPVKTFRLKFGRIAHSFSYNRYSQVYTDASPNVEYYPNIYIDSVNTYDSVYFQTMENTFSWTNADYLDRLSSQPFIIQFGIKHQIGNVKWNEVLPAISSAPTYKDGIAGDKVFGDPDLTGTQNVLSKSTFSHFIPYGEITISPHPFIKVFGKASYVLTGDDYQGDYNVYGLAKFQILRNKPYKTAFNFALDLSNTEAPYFYRHYYSNHFIWDNDFSKVSTNKLSAFITQRTTKIGVDAITMNDYLYIAADTLPRQFGSSIEILKAYWYQRFVLGKFDVDGRFVYQKVSEQDIIRLPEFMAYFTVTFNLQLFKGALKTRSGFDIYYFTKYYADTWMPAIRSFYPQNEMELGGYVHADFFLDFNVARTRFFMKMQNILQPFMENNYYQVPHYPLQDMAFKFGLSWRFHD